MTLSSAWIALFFAFALAAGALSSLGNQYYRVFQASLIERFDRFFSSQFIFLNSVHLFMLYIAAVVLVPILLWWAKIPWFICLVLSLIILIMPKFVFTALEKKRRKDIVNALPDVLQQISGALRAGATFTTALDALVTEREGPIAQEFTLVLREHRLGTRLDDCLDNLAERINSEEIDIVVSAILIAQDVGGNLSEVFNRLADTLRSKISMEERIRSLTAQGVMQGYVVTALPTVIVVWLMIFENDSMAPLFTSLLGWIFVAIILSLQITGGFIIQKIVRTDI